MKSIRNALFLIALVMSGSALATGPERLNAFVRDVVTLSAMFEQTVLDVDGHVVQESLGMVQIHRPGRFRWDYFNPYEQIIIADGEKVWLYDADLEQVTVKDQDSALGSTPALLLSGAHPQDNFEIEHEQRDDDLTWVRLIPKDKQNNYDTLYLGFEGDQLKRMEFKDSFDQITRFVFDKVETNPELLDSAFQFEPPEGVDVIEEDGF